MIRILLLIKGIFGAAAATKFYNFILAIIFLLFSYKKYLLSKNLFKIFQIPNSIS